MATLTPRDITQLVFGIVVFALFFYLIVPHGTKIRSVIDKQQIITDQLRVQQDKIIYRDSLEDLYFKKYMAVVDSVINQSNEKEAELNKQIRLLWLNNYELQKNYDSIRLVRPALPEF